MGVTVIHTKQNYKGVQEMDGTVTMFHRIDNVWTRPRHTQTHIERILEEVVNDKFQKIYWYNW